MARSFFFEIHSSRTGFVAEAADHFRGTVASALRLDEVGAGHAVARSADRDALVAFRSWLFGASGVRVGIVSPAGHAG